MLCRIEVSPHFCGKSPSLGLALSGSVLGAGPVHKGPGSLKPLQAPAHSPRCHLDPLEHIRALLPGGLECPNISEVHSGKPAISKAQSRDGEGGRCLLADNPSTLGHGHSLPRPLSPLDMATGPLDALSSASQGLSSSPVRGTMRQDKALTRPTVFFLAPASGLTEFGWQNCSLKALCGWSCGSPAALLPKSVGARGLEAGTSGAMSVT